MVKKGAFAVSLVNADTNLPFQEFRGPDGKDYTEVEPNAEYWVHIENFQATGEIYCRIEVDGKDLGYAAIVGRDPRNMGIWNTVGLQSTEQTLTVKALEGQGSSAFWIGQVKVDVYEAIKPAGRAAASKPPVANFVNPWNGGKGPSKSCELAKKAVASHIGKKKKTTKYSLAQLQEFALIHRGRLLQSLTLHYCTAVGLIHVGVLPKPTSWEYHRKLHPLDAADVPAYLAKLQPETMSRKTHDPSGNLVQEVFYDVFDLTGIDGNESGDSDSDVDNDDDNDFKNCEAPNVLNERGSVEEHKEDD